jgi:hypothetical protein
MEIDKKKTYRFVGKGHLDSGDMKMPDFRNHFSPDILYTIEYKDITTIPYYIAPLHAVDDWDGSWMSKLAFATNFIEEHSIYGASKEELLDYIKYMKMTDGVEEYLKVSRKLKDI